MIDLENQDVRKGLRTLVQLAIVLLLVVFLGVLIYILRNDNKACFYIAMYLCAMIGLFLAIVGAEDVGKVMVAFGLAKAQIGNIPNDQNGGSNG